MPVFFSLSALFRKSLRTQYFFFITCLTLWGVGPIIQIKVGNCGRKGVIVFLGINTLNLDAKGRLAIPVKYRKDLVGPEKSGVVVTVNPYERCLWLYPQNEWEEVARKVISLPDLKKQNKSLKRLLLGHASVLDLDGQGRILLSASLREYAGMEKAVALVGQGNKFEIWAEDAWLATRDDCLVSVMPDSEAELSDDLANLAL